MADPPAFQFHSQGGVTLIEGETTVKTISQILIYTRPWEIRFHLELARQLGAAHPGVPIVFYTFFSLAQRQALAAGYNCVYFPRALAEVNPAAADDARLMELEQELEATGSGNLLLQFHSERFRPAETMSQRDMLRRHVAVLDAAVKPGTLGISAMYDHFVYWLGGSLANARQGAHFAFIGAAMPPGRVQALRTPWEQWLGPEDPEADAWYDSCRATLALPPEERIAYMRPDIIPPLRRRWLKRLEEVRADLADRREGSYFGPASFTWRKSVETRWRRLFPRSDSSHYDLRTIEEVNAFPYRSIYIPLHFEPEATILMYSPWLRNQIEMCRLISQALPADTWMLVKENPKMVGMRSRQFFRDLKAMPNIRYVHPAVNPHAMMEKCELTVTLAGTTALEAKLLGKRVAVLGRPPHAFVLAPEERLGVEVQAEQIRRLLATPGTVLSRNAWRQLVRGTFAANCVPTWGAQRFEMDASAENVGKYAKYIRGCLELQAQTSSEIPTAPALSVD